MKNLLVHRFDIDQQDVHRMISSIKQYAEGNIWATETKQKILRDF
jgi:hypothetical protein